MSTPQIAFGILIVVLTAGLGVYYAWRQVQTLRRLRADPPFEEDECRYQRNQAWRRLVGAVLMLLFAGLFIGVFFFEGPAAELARLGHVSRARVSQVMGLLSLSPDLQEAVPFLPRTLRGRDPIPLWRLLPIASALDWLKQRRLWAGLHGR